MHNLHFTSLSVPTIVIEIDAGTVPFGKHSTCTRVNVVGRVLGPKRGSVMADGDWQTFAATDWIVV